MTYEEAYKSYRRRIESFCQYKLGTADGQLAEDLTSEIFLLLYTKWSALGSHEETRVLKWLYNAALIKVREHGRLASKRPLIYSLEEYHGADGETLPFDGEERDEEALYARYLAQIKAALPPRDRETFVYRVEKQYSIAQIAKEMRSSEAAVKVRWFRIKRKLRELLHELMEQ